MEIGIGVSSDRSTRYAESFVVENPGDDGASHHAYRGFFEHSVEGFFQTTPDGRYLRANPALARIYGYESLKGLMKALTDINAQLYVDPRRREEFARLMKDPGEVIGFESEVFRQDGSVIWISENARVVRDKDGKALFYEGAVQDITARKQAEFELRTSQRFIERVTQSSPNILYVYDLIQERYIYANDRIFKILGRTLDELIGMGPQFLQEFLHPEDNWLLKERASELSGADDGQVFEYEFRLLHADGTWRWMNARETIFTRMDDGLPHEVIGTAQDITERHQARMEVSRSREQLRALSVRLQSAREEERIHIAREIHDEMGGALTAMKMDVSKVLAECGGSQDEPSRVEAVKRRLSGTVALIDRTLASMRRIATELRPPVLDEFGIVAAIEWQIDEFQKRFGIRYELHNRWSPTLVQDQSLSTAVFRIFQEMLTNVARHSEATAVVVHLMEDAGHLVLRVRDNGRGITEGERREALGVLGMQERAGMFGGTVEIRGETGKGTVACMKIPLRKCVKNSGAPKKERLLP